MAGKMTLGRDVRVGDDLWLGGRPHRITRVEPYVHPVVTGGEEWLAAYDDHDRNRNGDPWGITLEPGRDYYMISR